MLLKENDLRKEIDMAIGRFGPEGQVEKRILRSSDPDANYELEFQHLGSGAEGRKGPLFFVEKTWNPQVSNVQQHPPVTFH